MIKNHTITNIIQKTIYACATAQAQAAIGIIRLSGKDSLRALWMLTKEKPFVPRKMCLATLTHPHSGILLDEALVVYFRAPYSFTGLDCVELHLHGGENVMASVLRALGEIDFLTQAGPWRFLKTSCFKRGFGAFGSRSDGRFN